MEVYSGSMIPFYSEFYHINVPKRDSNLGLIMSHRLNYEAAALTTRPPRRVNDDDSNDDTQGPTCYLDKKGMERIMN